MKTKRLILVLILVLVLAASGLALANGGFALPRAVLSGGASDSAANGAAVHATLGQPIVGVVSEGEIIMKQGFWSGGERPGYIYLPYLGK